MPMRYFLALSLLALALQACHSSKAIQSDSNQRYQVIPAERLAVLSEECDYIDFLFYHHDFSMSQNHRQSIRTTVAGISSSPANIKSSCKADGRIYFMAEGETLVEAEIFLDPDCAYYIFFENGERTHANQMTEDGLNFYTNVFQQAEQTRGQ